jgi:hypothetical protein
MAEFISGSVWRAKSPNAQADEAAGPSHPPPRYAAKYRLSTLHQAREGDTRAVLCVAAAATSSPWSAPPPGWPFAGYPPGRPGGAPNVRAIASVRTTAEELCLAGSVFRSDYLFLPIAAAFSLPSSGQLPLYDGDLAVVFQDCRPDLRYIRAALMAQRFGKLCQRNVLPLHLVSTVAPVSDKDFGRTFEKPPGALAIVSQHGHAVGQSDERCGRD